MRLTPELLLEPLTHLGLQIVVGLADGGSVEGVGLDDVRASFQVLDVDGLNDVRAGQHKQIVVALQLITVVLVAVAAEVSLLSMHNTKSGIKASA